MIKEITREKDMLQEDDILVMQEERGCCYNQREKKRTGKEEWGLMNRLSRIEGQIRRIRSMTEDGRYYVDILTQVSTAQMVLDSFNKMLLSNHIKTYMMEGIERGNTEVVDELCKTTQRLVKQGNRTAVEF